MPEIYPKRDPIVVLETIYARAAKMHALHWKEKSLIQSNWLKGAMVKRKTNQKKEIKKGKYKT